MKDLKELMDEMELDEVVGGLASPLVARPELADLNDLASKLASRLASEGYTAETLADRIASLSLADRLALAKIFIPDRLASGLIEENDGSALASSLADELKKRLVL